LVARAGQDPTDARHFALAELLACYIEPLRVHLIARRRVRPQEAEDLIQAFVADRVLAGDLIARADQGRGRFRNFLLTALDNFVRNRVRADLARKRSSGGAIAGDDALDVAADPTGVAPDAAFDVAWARQVLAQAVDEMRQHCDRIGRADVWGVFEGRVLQPTLGGASDATPYDELVARFGFVSPAQASNALVTANRMLQRFLRAVVGRYEPDAGRVDEELADLRRILGRAGAGPARGRCNPS
jgi:RNA polymerase sigma-70 factor (ECF subfamily)